MTSAPTVDYTTVPAEAAKQYFVFCVLEKQINNDDKLMTQTTRLTEGK